MLLLITHPDPSSSGGYCLLILFKCQSQTLPYPLGCADMAERGCFQGQADLFFFFQLLRSSQPVPLSFPQSLC